MPKSWEDMSVDEKLDRLRHILETFIEHYNNNVINRDTSMKRIDDRLKKIEEVMSTARTIGSCGL